MDRYYYALPVIGECGVYWYAPSPLCRFALLTHPGERIRGSISWACGRRFAVARN